MFPQGEGFTWGGAMPPRGMRPLEGPMGVGGPDSRRLNGARIVIRNKMLEHYYPNIAASGAARGAIEGAASVVGAFGGATAGGAVGGIPGAIIAGGVGGATGEAAAKFAMGPERGETPMREREDIASFMHEFDQIAGPGAGGPRTVREVELAYNDIQRIATQDYRFAKSTTAWSLKGCALGFSLGATAHHAATAAHHTSREIMNQVGEKATEEIYREGVESSTGAGGAWMFHRLQ